MPESKKDKEVNKAKSARASLVARYPVTASGLSRSTDLAISLKRLPVTSIVESASWRAR
jgi:hypothetical protein